MTDNTSLNNQRPIPAKARELLEDRSPAQIVDGRFAANLPIWIRSPKKGTEYYTGLSRAKLYELAGGGKITSRSIRDVGQIRGTRLFLLQSILDFIAGSSDSRPQAENQLN